MTIPALIASNTAGTQTYPLYSGNSLATEIPANAKKNTRSINMIIMI